MALTYQENINDSKLHLFRLGRRRQSENYFCCFGCKKKKKRKKSGVKVRRSEVKINALLSLPSDTVECGFFSKVCTDFICDFFYCND